MVSTANNMFTYKGYETTKGRGREEENLFDLSVIKRIKVSPPPTPNDPFSADSYLKAIND